MFPQNLSFLRKFIFFMHHWAFPPPFSPQLLHHLQRRTSFFISWVFIECLPCTAWTLGVVSEQDKGHWPHGADLLAQGDRTISKNKKKRSEVCSMLRCAVYYGEKQEWSRIRSIGKAVHREGASYSREWGGQGRHFWEVKVCKTSWRWGRWPEHVSRDKHFGQENNPSAKALWWGQGEQGIGEAEEREVGDHDRESNGADYWCPSGVLSREFTRWLIYSQRTALTAMLKGDPEGAKAEQGGFPDTILEATLEQQFSTLAVHLNPLGNFTKLRPESYNTNWFRIQSGPWDFAKPPRWFDTQLRLTLVF